MKSADFLTNMDFKCTIDVEKFIINGQSMGGITALKCAMGNQDTFKGVVSLDPAHTTDKQMTEYEMNVPCHII